MTRVILYTSDGERERGDDCFSEVGSAATMRGLSSGSFLEKVPVVF